MRTIDMLPSGGRVAPGWEPMQEAFAGNFKHHNNINTTYYIYLHKHPIINL